MPSYDPAFDLAVAHALVRRASSGDLDEAVRVYRPDGNVVAFGRRDTHQPGFPAAVEACRAAGFEPAVRATGGRAVAYTSQSLVIDHVRNEAEPTGGHDRRFLEFGEQFVSVFRELGIDARLGAVPGEYCPGAHSVNARGVAKLVGTSQRVNKSAWLFSSLVVVGDEDVVRPVLVAVYDALGQELDPASVGSLSAEVPGLSVDQVAAALGQVSVEPDEQTVALARELVADHRA